MDVLEAIRKRRSINFFEAGKEIPEGKLRELLEIANLAPSSFNLQPWKVVVVRDPARKKALRKCANDQEKIEQASAVLIMVADPMGVEENRDRVLESWVETGYIKAETRQAMTALMDRLYGSPDSRRRTIFAVKNTALYAMTLMLAAKGLGLETHPMDGFDEDCVKKEFSIPADKIVPMLVAVGSLRQGAKMLPRAFRRQVGEFARFERYD